MDNQFFKNIEKKTGVSMNDVMQARKFAAKCQLQG